MDNWPSYWDARLKVELRCLYQSSNPFEGRVVSLEYLDFVSMCVWALADIAQPDSGLFIC